MNYLPELALNHDPPDLCFLSSQDYRCEPPVPSRHSVLVYKKCSLKKVDLGMCSPNSLLRLWGIIADLHVQLLCMCDIISKLKKNEDINIQTNYRKHKVSHSSFREVFTPGFVGVRVPSCGVPSTVCQLETNGFSNFVILPQVHKWSPLRVLRSHLVQLVALAQGFSLPGPQRYLCLLPSKF
jgi:hypothetical protein